MDKVQLGQRYILKDILPQIYQDIYYRAMYLLNQDSYKIQDRLDNLGIVFEIGNIEQNAYDRDRHAVILYLPNYYLHGKYFGVEQGRSVVKLSDIQQFVSSDVLVQGSIIHEIMHSFQNLKDITNGKQLEYDKQLKEVEIGKKKQEDINYELGAILESIFHDKKKGVTLDDIKKKVNYHLFNIYKEHAKIFEEFEDLYKKYNLLKQSNLSNETINKTKENIIEIKNNIINGIEKFFHNKYKFSNFDEALFYFKKHIKESNKKDEPGYEILYQLIDRIEKYWDKDNGWQVGYERSELPKKLWSFILQEMIKYANSLDQYKFYKKASVCDDYIREVFYAIS